MFSWKSETVKTELTINILQGSYKWKLSNVNIHVKNVMTDINMELNGLKQTVEDVS